ncbi:putative ribonuclease H protein, partial [Trifolium medium]|nr:putative ribonuclease H protein [Trifolium medium]
MFWVKILKAKYGGDIVHVSNLSSCGDAKFASLWWKDLCSLGRMVTSEDGDWLFSISLQTQDCIDTMGERRNGVWLWNLKWRPPLFVWEEELLNQLMAQLGQVTISQVEDSWVCVVGADGKYTVKNGYAFLSENFLPLLELDESECRVLNQVWESLSPMKVQIFSWQLLLHRLPTRANLLVRGVIRSAAQSRPALRVPNRTTLLGTKASP